MHDSAAANTRGQREGRGVGPAQVRGQCMQKRAGGCVGYCRLANHTKHTNRHKFLHIIVWLWGFLFIGGIAGCTMATEQLSRLQTQELDLGKALHLLEKEIYVRESRYLDESQTMGNVVHVGIRRCQRQFLHSPFHFAGLGRSG